MNLLSFRRTLSLFLIVGFLGLTAPAAFSAEKGKANAKGKQKVESKQNHGREAGKLPYGLIRHTEKKGELPSGLQKKAEDGQLPRGLEEGGKKIKTAGKGKKLPNN
jgi:hypothetical protein